MRNGRFSPALVASDVRAILALYRANGFDKAEVKTTVRDSDTAGNGKPLKEDQIAVTFEVTEGPQQKFGVVNLTGVDKSRLSAVTELMNTQSGQPFSLVTLSGDRDAVLGLLPEPWLRSGKGRDQAVAGADRSDEDRCVVECCGGPAGIHRQGAAVGSRSHAGRALCRTRFWCIRAIRWTRARLLRDAAEPVRRLALFNEVVTAVQNPTGDAPRKNVLVQVTEAKRWNVTYGLGFEAQTGTPTQGMISEASRIQLGLPPNETITQEGKAGVSPRVSLDVTRINLQGHGELV